MYLFTKCGIAFVSMFRTLCFLLFLYLFLINIPTFMLSTDCEENNGNNCWAVAPYVEHFPLPQFGQNLNEIVIGDFKFLFHQSWKSLGVAGVVWDCVKKLLNVILNQFYLIITV